MPRQGAAITVRRAGQADGGAQVHQRLVHVAGAVKGHQALALFIQQPFNGRAANVIAYVKQPGNGPVQVAIHGWHRLLEGDGGHGSSRIGADARQLLKLFCRGGEALLGNEAGSL